MVEVVVGQPDPREIGRVDHRAERLDEVGAVDAETGVDQDRLFGQQDERS